MAQVPMMALSLSVLLLFAGASADSSEEETVEWVSYQGVSCGKAGVTKALGCNTWLQVQPKSADRPYTVQLRYCHGSLEARSNNGKAVNFNVKPNTCYGAGAKLAEFWRTLAAQYRASEAASQALQTKTGLEKCAEKLMKSSLESSEKAHEKLRQSKQTMAKSAEATTLTKGKHAAVMELATKAEKKYTSSENKWKEKAHKKSAGEAKLQQVTAEKATKTAVKAQAVADKEKKLADEKNAKLAAHTHAKSPSENAKASKSGEDALSVRAKVAKALISGGAELGESGFGYSQHELSNLFSSIAAWAAPTRRSVVASLVGTEDVQNLGPHTELGDSLTSPTPLSDDARGKAAASSINSTTVAKDDPDAVDLSGPFVQDCGSFKLNTHDE